MNNSTTKRSGYFNITERDVERFRRGQERTLARCVNLLLQAYPAQSNAKEAFIDGIHRQESGAGGHAVADHPAISGHATRIRHGALVRQPPQQDTNVRVVLGWKASSTNSSLLVPQKCASPCLA